MPKLNLLLDSGAYSAWNSGVALNLMDYIRYCHDNARWIGRCVNLDVIAPGDPEGAAAAGMTNYKEMRAAGLDPIPVFHVGENVKWLHQMLDMGADYIGLSASSIISPSKAAEWYDIIWNILVDRHGLPLVKCHAFGEGRATVLAQNPWCSSDTASWIYDSIRTATIMVNGKRVVNSRSPVNHMTENNVATMSGHNLQAWTAALKKYGIASKGFELNDETGYVVRAYLAAQHYMEIAHRISAICPIYKPGSGLMLTAGERAGDPIHLPQFHLHLAMGTNPLSTAVVAASGVKDVLISYAHLLQHRSRYPCFGDFAMDPAATVLLHKPYLKQFNLLKEHLGC